MTPVLETQKLCKSFGALTVAQNIDFRLQPGDRHALIGPNGAGKTTFVNMLMGALAPSSGRIYLGGEDVTRVRQAQRVKRGLGRTFQINALFRHLPVLDNVALGIAERRGERPMAPGLVAQGSDPGKPGAAFHPRPRRRRKHPVKDLPYGKQRLVEIAIALGLSPKVLLLDEPAAGVPSMESERILRCSTGCRPRSRSSSSSTTWISCSASQDGSRAVQGEVLTEGRRANRTRPPRAPGLPRRAAPCLTPCRSEPELRATARPWCSGTSRSRCPSAARARGPRQERRRQDHAPRHHHGAHHVPFRGDPVQRAARAPAAGVPTRAPRHRLRAAGTAHLPVPQRAREPHRRRASWALERRAGLRALPAPEGAARRHGQPALRRRAADARDRPRADGKPPLLLLDEPRGLARSSSKCFWFLSKLISKTRSHHPPSSTPRWRLGHRHRAGPEPRRITHYGPSAELLKDPEADEPDRGAVAARGSFSAERDFRTASARPIQSYVAESNALELPRIM